MLVKNFKIKSNGFTLIELVLVTSIGLAMSFLAFNTMVKNQEADMANSVGEQMKTLGNAVNNYIVNHYDSLSSLKDSQNTQTDIGPRNCNTGNSTCTITTDTLKAEGLVQPNFTGINSYGSRYTIVFKRSGAAPYWNITGLVTTTDPWLGTSNSIRYDLLGKAMQKAGLDSGMVYNNPTRLDGFKSIWSADNTNFYNIQKRGQLGYITGYGSNSYAVFLRRDGTLPMTGDLNMGTKSINNANNITASGKGLFGNIVSDTTIVANNDITAKGSIISGKPIQGHNGAGDAFSIGGWDGNDYEFHLGTTKPLTIWHNGGASNEKRLQVWGLQENTGNLVVKGANDGLSSGEITASGNITTQSKLIGQTLSLNQMVALGNTCPTIGEMARDNQGYALSCVNYKWSTMYQSVNTNVIGTNNASIIAQANHKKVIITVASLFLPRDGGHTSYANFTVYKNGSPVSTFQNNINVHKGGSRGHYWGYQSGRTKMMEYTIPVNTGDTISVNTTGSYLLSSSDVRIELF